MNRRVLCDDSLEDPHSFFAAKAPSWVTTQNIHILRFCYLVPESFKPNRCIRVSLLPQERCAFSASRNARMPSPCRSPRCHNESTRDLPKLNWVRRIIDHECGERVAGIQRDISPLVNGGGKVQSVCHQAVKKSVPV